VMRTAADDPEPEHALRRQLALRSPGADVLVAYVEGDVEPADVRRRASEVLPAAIVPAIVERVDALARTDHGKVDRAALAPPVRFRDQRAATAVAGQGAVLDVVVDVWRDVLGDPTIDADSDYFAHGGNSLGAVTLVARLEARLGSRVPISALVDGRTPRRLAAIIGPSTVTLRTERSNVVHLRPQGGRVPLFVMPPGGGNLVVFDPLVRAVDADIPIIGLDLPGADLDEPLPDDIETLAARYLPQVMEAQPFGPIRAIGWSMGGAVALELAQQLVRAGRDVELVAMIDTIYPGMQRAGRSREYVRLARERDVVGIGRKAAHTIARRAQYAATQWRGRRAGDERTEMTLDDRITWLMLSVDDMVERYAPRPYDGAVVYFAATSTFPWRSTEPWRALLPQLQVVPLDGAHEGLLVPPVVDVIAAETVLRMRG
jgi:thioesterase domain-containing protein/acyl carrier protein